MQFAVAAAALLGDRTALQVVEPRAGHVQLVEHGERQREHDEVGDHLARAARTLERHSIASVGGFRQPHQALPDPDDVAAQMAGDEIGQLLIAAADVERLVGFAEHRQRAGGRAETQGEKSG